MRAQAASRRSRRARRARPSFRLRSRRSSRSARTRRREPVPPRPPSARVRPSCRQSLPELRRRLLHRLERVRLLAPVLLERPHVQLPAVDGEGRRELDQALVERKLEVLRLRGGAGEEDVAQPRLDELLDVVIVLAAEAFERRRDRARRLGAELQEDLFHAGRVRARLLEVLGERLHEPLAVGLLPELRQHLEGEDPLDPQRLREELQEEVPRVAQLTGDGSALLRGCAGVETRLDFSRLARRSASAMITSAGFAEPSVGRTLPSQTKRFETFHARWLSSTTLSSAEKPIRQPPTRWA